MMQAGKAGVGGSSNVKSKQQKLARMLPPKHEGKLVHSHALQTRLQPLLLRRGCPLGLKGAAA